MNDPVILLETKQTYDKESLLQHFATQVKSGIKKTCPKTGLVLKNQSPENDLFPNYSLRDAIEEWKLDIKESEEAEKKSKQEEKKETKKDGVSGGVSQFALFNQLREAELKALLPEFLQMVAYGKQSEAENMLKKNPELLLLKGSVTDYSGRRFESLTGYQLATWSLDWRGAGWEAEAGSTPKLIWRH